MNITKLSFDVFCAENESENIFQQTQTLNTNNISDQKQSDKKKDKIQHLNFYNVYFDKILFPIMAH